MTATRALLARAGGPLTAHEFAAAFEEMLAHAPFLRKELADTGVHLKTGVAPHGRETLPRIALAVSGGPDSLALAALAAAALGRSRLVALFVDHGMGARGVTEDGERVAALMARIGVPLHTVRLRWRPDMQCAAGDVLPAHGRVQEVLRFRRYAAMRDACAHHGARLLLTGHNLDDDVATMLYRLASCSGVDGLAGMRPVAAAPVGVHVADALFDDAAPGEALGDGAPEESSDEPDVAAVHMRIPKRTTARARTTAPVISRVYTPASHAPDGVLVGRPLLGVPKARLLETCLAAFGRASVPLAQNGIASVPLAPNGIASVPLTPNDTSSVSPVPNDTASVSPAPSDTASVPPAPNDIASVSPAPKKDVRTDVPWVCDESNADTRYRRNAIMAAVLAMQRAGTVAPIGPYPSESSAAPTDVHGAIGDPRNSAQDNEARGDNTGSQSIDTPPTSGSQSLETAPTNGSQSLDTTLPTKGAQSSDTPPTKGAQSIDTALNGAQSSDIPPTNEEPPPVDLCEMLSFFKDVRRDMHRDVSEALRGSALWDPSNGDATLVLNAPARAWMAKKPVAARVLAVLAQMSAARPFPPRMRRIHEIHAQISAALAAQDAALDARRTHRRTGSRGAPGVVQLDATRRIALSQMVASGATFLSLSRADAMRRIQSSALAASPSPADASYGPAFAVLSQPPAGMRPNAAGFGQRAFAVPPGRAVLWDGRFWLARTRSCEQDVVFTAAHATAADVRAFEEATRGRRECAAARRALLQWAARTPGSHYYHIPVVRIAADAVEGAVRDAYVAFPTLGVEYPAPRFAWAVACEGQSIVVDRFKCLP